MYVVIPVVCRAQQRQSLVATLLSRETTARKQEEAACALNKRVLPGQLEGRVVQRPGSVEILQMSVQHLQKEGGKRENACNGQRYHRRG